MVGNTDKKPVTRDIECHCPGIAIFSRYKILVFHRKLITELVFTKDCDLLGEHVTDTSHSFDSEVFFAESHLP